MHFLWKKLFLIKETFGYNFICIYCTYFHKERRFDWVNKQLSTTIQNCLATTGTAVAKSISHIQRQQGSYWSLPGRRGCSFSFLRESPSAHNQAFWLITNYFAGSNSSSPTLSWGFRRGTTSSQSRPSCGKKFLQCTQPMGKGYKPVLNKKSEASCKVRAKLKGYRRVRSDMV